MMVACSIASGAKGRAPSKTDAPRSLNERAHCLRGSLSYRSRGLGYSYRTSIRLMLLVFRPSASLVLLTTTLLMVFLTVDDYHATVPRGLPDSGTYALRFFGCMSLSLIDLSSHEKG